MNGQRREKLASWLKNKQTRKVSPKDTPTKRNPWIAPGKVADMVSPSSKNFLVQNQNQSRSNTPKKAGPFKQRTAKTLLPKQAPARASVTTAMASTIASSRQSLVRGKQHNLSKIQEEMETIFKEYSRTAAILNSTTVSHQKKQLVDTSKWKRKFKVLFD